MITKRERFAWRNGDQVMSAPVGRGLTINEIEAIRMAMHGAALPRRDLHVPPAGTHAKMYVLPGR